MQWHTNIDAGIPILVPKAGNLPSWLHAGLAMAGIGGNMNVTDQT